MRTITFILGICLAASGLLPLQAQKLIAVHHQGTASFYTDILQAYNAAVNGDTIYLPGGSFFGLDLSKSLTIIGVGHHPDSTVATGRTVLSSLSLSAGADNSIIVGVYVFQSLHSNGDISDVKISRCYLNQGIIFSSGQRVSWIISESWIASYNSFSIRNLGGASSNFLVANNVFGGAVQSISSSEVSNNILLSEYISGNDIVFRNNISHNSSSLTGNASYSHYYNNLNSGINGGPTSNGNTGVDNYLDNVSLPDVFVNYAPGNIFYQNDFHVVNPTYLGQDGLPIGIYGGVFPWKEGSLPFTPHVSSKAINATTNPDGTLHINITVKAQDN